MYAGIADGLRRWRAEGTPFALATVVRTRNSAPRPAGTAMAVSADGQVLGSLSGGCVEGDVYERAQRVLAGGAADLVGYGISDAEAFGVGLTCGGEFEVLIEPVDQEHFTEIDLLLERIARDEPVALATWLDPGATTLRHLLADAEGILGEPDGGTEAAERPLRSLIGTAATRTVELCGPDGGLARDQAVFLHSSAPPARMIVFGAVDFAASLAKVGTLLGYRVTICDARAVFATQDRFPEAEVVVDWPHRYLAAQAVDERTVLCVLTHDPKFDVPLLRVALQTEAGYIGVMGSRRTHDDRVRRLRAAGVGDHELARLHSPIGLDLGARSPEETAISIAAEIIAASTGRSGLRLRDLESPIHDLTVADRRTGS